MEKETQQEGGPDSQTTKMPAGTKICIFILLIVLLFYTLGCNDNASTTEKSNGIATWISVIICVYIASSFICKWLLNHAIKIIPGFKDYVEQSPMVETAVNYVVFIPLMNTGIVLFVTYMETKFFLKRLFNKPGNKPE